MKKRNFIYLILLLVYLGLVTWLCFGHFDGLPKVQKDFFGIPVDKVVHFLMFLPFPFLSFKTFDYLAKKPWQAVLASLVIFAVGCAILTLYAGAELPQDIEACYDLVGRCSGLIALKNGAVAEQGTFSELMEQKGYFYSLYTVSQAA